MLTIADRTAATEHAESAGLFRLFWENVDEKGKCRRNGQRSRCGGILMSRMHGAKTNE